MRIKGFKSKLRLLYIRLKIKLGIASPTEKGIYFCSFFSKGMKQGITSNKVNPFDNLRLTCKILESLEDDSLE